MALMTTGFHLPYDPNLRERARDLRKSQTKWEKKLWFEFLSNKTPQFYRQKPIDHYIADFYCPKLKLVIEIDGNQHVAEDSIEYDRIRSEVLESYCLKIIRFSNSDIEKSFDFVCSSIQKELDKKSLPY
jgi:very-short-patch-repair endonuclease